MTDQEARVRTEEIEWHGKTTLAGIERAVERRKHGFKAGMCLMICGTILGMVFLMKGCEEHRIDANKSLGRASGALL